MNFQTKPFLVVLRSANIEKSRAFYEAIGLTFVEEQHGNGPLHLACETDTLVFELYPGEDAPILEAKHSSATMIGFNVESLDAVCKRASSTRCYAEVVAERYVLRTMGKCRRSRRTLCIIERTTM